MRNNSQDATRIHTAQAALPLRLFTAMLTGLSGCRASSALTATLSLHFILWPPTTLGADMLAGMQRVFGDTCELVRDKFADFICLNTLSAMWSISLMPCRVDQCQAEPWYAIKLIPVCKRRHHSETSWCTGEVSHWACTLLAFVYPGVIPLMVHTLCGCVVYQTACFPPLPYAFWSIRIYLCCYRKGQTNDDIGCGFCWQHLFTICVALCAGCVTRRSLPN